MKLKFMTGIQIAFFSILIAATVQSVFADGGSGNRAKFQAAVQTCATQLNLTTPIDWKSMDQTTRGDFHACMKTQGVSMHHHRHWKAIRACVEKAGVTLPQFTPGQRPELSDAQKAAIQTCRQELRAAHEAAKSTSVNN